MESRDLSASEQELSVLNEIQTLCKACPEPVYCPASVCRIQINRNFTFHQAVGVAPLLSALGFDAVFVSPVFEAVPGSLHGYDITNFGRINPEIGTEQDFIEFSSKLRSLGMGLVLDVVPNHMGIKSDSNVLWNDVLENGPSSRYAHFFDIEWEPVKRELKGKILLPVLTDQYGVVLENQEIRLVFSGGAFSIACPGRSFPLAPDTYPMILELEIEKLSSELGVDNRDLLEYLSIIASLKNLPSRADSRSEKIMERAREKEIAKERLKTLTERSAAIADAIAGRIKRFNGEKDNARSFDLLDELLNHQSYRLAYWRVASEEINYRRFFDINDLAAIRMEDARVLDDHHRYLFELLGKGHAHGIRVDHPDGLYDPVEYFEKIQQEFLIIYILNALEKQGRFLAEQDQNRLKGMIRTGAFKPQRPLYTVAEKILDRREDLPDSWLVCGTVGYDFLNVLNGVFIRKENEAACTGIYEKFIGAAMDFDQLVYEKKKFFAAFYMSSELNTLGHRLNLISETLRAYRDFTLSNLTTTIREVIACFPVYRTYIRRDDVTPSERDQKYIEIAVERAKRKHPALNPSIFDFLKQVLAGKFEEEVGEEQRRSFREFVLKFQQLTAPIMAKGMEDTVFYIYNRLVSLNEVGGDPTHFGHSPAEFHTHNALKLKNWPYSMITTSTHDTKRSSDVRMRINVLTEVPAEWEDRVSAWSRINEPHKTVLNGKTFPDQNTEYFMYQTLLGVWPLEPLKAEDTPVFEERLWNYFLKAGREAKLYTNWLNPNADYEEAVRKFLRGLISPELNQTFMASFRPFQEKISRYGLYNSLSAAVLKIPSPGVPDYYQGTVMWDFTLVDPDNRRPVDYEKHRNQLRQLETLEQSGVSGDNIVEELVRTMEDGRIKMYVTWKLLNLRKRHRRVFMDGEYVSLNCEGPRAVHIIAFARRMDRQVLIAVASRFFAELLPDPVERPWGKPLWQDTEIIIPAGLLKNGSELRDCFTGRRIQLQHRGEQTSLPAGELLQSFSTAVLTNLE